MNVDNVNIVGAGSLGGFQVLLLSKMVSYLGCRIKVIDFDHVESKNIQNQVYRSVDVGKLKVTSLKKITKLMSETNIKIENRSAGADTDFSGVVITLTHDMVSRKNVFQACRYNTGVNYYIDARTGGNIAVVYAFNPNDTDWVERYEKTLYDDSNVPVPVCALPETVPTLWATASTIASLITGFKNTRVFRNEFIEVVLNMEGLPIVNSMLYNPL